MLRLMRILRKLFIVAALAGTTIGLASCGGGGTTLASGGTGGTGIAFGSVTGFGSVFVKGIEFDVSGATITADGQPATQSDLRLGMVVKVTGTIAADGKTGTATTLEFNRDFSGPVASIDSTANTFTVLGQAIKVNTETVYDGVSFANLAGKTVEVSGFRDASGALVASWVSLEQSSGTVEVEGTVTSVGSGTFQIGSLKVNYSGAVTNGSFVEVQGTYDGSAGVLTASSVEAKSSGLGGSDGQEAEIEGYVDSFADATNFTVAGQAVTTDGSTQYVNGTAGDLAADKKLEVKGSINASGVLLAESIEFKTEADSEIEATVDGVDAATGTLVFFNGTGKMLTVYTDSQTSYGDESSQDVRPFGFGQVSTGDYLEIRGAIDSSTGHFVASQVLRQDSSNECSLAGPVSTVDSTATTFTVDGVLADTDAATQFLKVDETPYASEADFYAALAVGDKVQATWSTCTISGPPDEVERD